MGYNVGMLNFNSVMLGSTQPKVLADFYEKVFEKAPDWQDGSWSGWQVGDTHITIGEHSEAKGKSKDPVRVMLNFETDDVQGEFDRISKIDGVEVIKEPYHPGEVEEMFIATLADPDGNYFQLMSPYKMDNSKVN